jgi:anti-anti-sigma factor
MELSVSTQALGERALVTPTGKIMYDTRRPLEVALEQVGSQQVVIDLSATTMCDSSGLQVLLDAHFRRSGAGGWVRLVQPQPLVRRVLEITNLLEVLSVYRSVDAALAD